MENLEDRPVLAQYSVRSKQAYIFATNRLLEVVGASAIIAETFDLLFDCAMEEAGSETERVRRSRDRDGTFCLFCLNDVRKNFSGSAWDMVELFTGGGNCTVLYRNMEICRRINARYTLRVLKEFPGLLPMYVGVPVDLDSEKPDYRADYQRLMAESDSVKSRMLPGRGYAAVPFALMDRTTFQPISQRRRTGEGERELSAESAVKRDAGRRDAKNDPDVRFLDSMITQRGRESLLAIVHADGNNMGRKIQKKLGAETDYDFCVNAIRGFTGNIDAAFKDAGRAAVERQRKAMPGLHPKARKEAFALRWIVSDGDDATFICNARYAAEYTRAYLQGVAEYHSEKDPGEHYSSCAGICIFHSHYPFAKAYALAEQACDNAKKPVHETLAEECWLDFHFIRGGAGGDLDELRELHRTGKCMARPWRVAPEDGNGVRDIGRLDALAGLLREAKLSRTNIKTLGAVYESDGEQGKLEWDRICYRSPGLRAKAQALFPGEDAANVLNPLYDLSEIWDLWYRGEGERDDGEAQNHPAV